MRLEAQISFARLQDLEQKEKHLDGLLEVLRIAERSARHYADTDAYANGYANGIIAATALVERRDPAFVEPHKPDTATVTGKRTVKEESDRAAWAEAENRIAQEQAPSKLQMARTAFGVHWVEDGDDTGERIRKWALVALEENLSNEDFITGLWLAVARDKGEPVNEAEPLSAPELDVLASVMEVPAGSLRSLGVDGVQGPIGTRRPQTVMEVAQEIATLREDYGLTFDAAALVQKKRAHHRALNAAPNCEPWFRRVLHDLIDNMRG